MQLVGKSLKGKNRIREHGTEWHVLREDRIQAFDGVGLFIASTQTGERRWIQKDNDPDFEVVG